MHVVRCRVSCIAAVTVAFVLLHVPLASAQGFQEPDYFAGSHEDAHQAAIDSHRLHLVFLDSENPDLAEAEKRLWSNRSLNQWIRWHAVLSRVSAIEDPALFYALADPLFEGAGKNQRWDATKHLTVLVFRGDELERVLPWFPHADTRKGAPRFRRGMVPDPELHHLELKPLEVLHQAQFVLDKLQATDPVWFERHSRKNPPPPPPDRVRFAAIADANAPACAGPPEGQTVLSMLVRAREEAAAASLADATATYTWLWERLDEGRPWATPLRRTLVAAEMRDLAARREGSAARFTAMRDEQASREPWLDLDQRLDRYLLDEIVGREDDSLFELDYLFNDPDESSLLTRSESAGLTLIASGVPWLDIWSIGADDVARLEKLRSGLLQKRPPTATDEEWTHVLDLRRAILLTESCRIHAALLRQGRVAEAARVADALIAPDSSGVARLALASVAWAADAADARHEAWTREAIALGQDDAGLLLALQAGPVRP